MFPHFVLNFSAQELLENNTMLGDLLMCHPLQMLGLFDIALKRAQRDILQDLRDQDQDGLVCLSI